MIFKSQNKRQSREETIIKPFIGSFKKFPEDGQYWTLCAECYNDGPIEDSEFHQSTNSLIKPHQFYGVDIDENVISNNKRLNKGNFFCGDFYQVISSRQDFNPTIVNFDCLRTFAVEKNNIKKIFILLNEYENVLFNFNVLLENYRVKPRDPQEIIDFLTKDPDIAPRFRNWDTKNVRFYPYKGLGNKTTMFSVTLVKKQP